MLDSSRWTNFTALDAYCRANLATPPWRLQLGICSLLIVHAHPDPAPTASAGQDLAALDGCCHANLAAPSDGFR